MNRSIPGMTIKPVVSLLLAGVVAVVARHPAEIVVDAYAGASATKVVVAKPKLTLSTPSGAPAIVINGNQSHLQAVVGQPVTVDIAADDPNGYNGFVFTGVTQNNRFYYSATSYLYDHGGRMQLANAQTALLPTGAVLNNLYQTGGRFNRSVFTWTPKPADNNTSVTVSFIAGNYYYPGAPVSRMQNLTIDTVDASAPSFSMPAQQTLQPGVAARIPVVVVADGDTDNVLITAVSLPAGAVLGIPAKNAAGQWVAVLTWTPTAAQVGSTVIEFQAQDAQETAIVSNPVSFTVQSGDSPVFASTMQTPLTLTQNELVNYQVVVIPDLQTTDVSITATGLPAGASLGKPVLDNGQLVAELTWRPDASQIGSSYPVTFAAVDNIAGAVPVTFTATFTVLPHYSVLDNRSRLRR